MQRGPKPRQRVGTTVKAQECSAIILLVSEEFDRISLHSLERVTVTLKESLMNYIKLLVN